MAKNAGYALPDDITPEESIYVCIPIPDSPGHRRAFAGALHELARWWNWEKDDQKHGKEAAAVWFDIFRSVMVQMDQRLDSCGGNGDCPDGTTDTTCSNYSGCGGLLVIDESDNEMSNQFIYSEEFDPPRIGINCGCGTIKWFNLNPVNNDAVMVQKVRDDKSIIPSTKFSKIVSSGNMTCYAVSAVEWIFGRAVDMHTFLVDAAVLGIDVLSGDIDEGLDGFLLLADLLNGANDIMDVVEVSKGQVASVFGDQDLIDLMVAEWNFDGGVTRDELDAWIENAPHFVWGVPVRLLLYLWMVYGLLSNYNQNLEMLAAECESGFSLSDGGIPGAGGTGGGVPGYGDGAVETEVEHEGSTYPVWTWTLPPFTFYDAGDMLSVIDVGPIAAMGWTFRQIDDWGSTAFSLYDGATDYWISALMHYSATNEVYALRTTNQSRIVLEGLQGVPTFIDIETFDYPLWLTMYAHDQGTERIELSELIIVGEPLP